MSTYAKDTVKTVTLDIKELANFLTVACNASAECDTATCPSIHIKGLVCPNDSNGWCQKVADDAWLDILREHELLRSYEQQQK